MRKSTCQLKTNLDKTLAQNEEILSRLLVNCKLLNVNCEHLLNFGQLGKLGNHKIIAKKKLPIMGALRTGWVRGSSDVKWRRRYYDQKFDKLQRNMDESVSGTVLTRLAPLLHMT